MRSARRCSSKQKPAVRNGEAGRVAAPRLSHSMRLAEARTDKTISEDRGRLGHLLGHAAGGALADIATTWVGLTGVSGSDPHSFDIGRPNSAT